MIDISKQERLEAYLTAREVVKPGDGHTIRYCKGGVSGTVVFIERPKETPVIIKQALEQLKVSETWLCDPNRMGIEYESNRIYHELLPEYAPEVYFYDKDNYIFGREAVPDNCLMWKADLMSGLLDFQVAGKAIETLSVVHNGCADNKEIAEKFNNKGIFYGLRINPYIEFIVKKHPRLEKSAARVIKEMMDSRITLVHGDYSPKNIMVVGRGISVLDYEVAHYGHPAFDLAFFFNHFILKAFNFPQWSGAFLTMMRFMADIYMRQVHYMEPKKLEECAVRTLALLMIARVDGKSPVEYLVPQPDKQEKVRKAAFSMIDQETDTFSGVLEAVNMYV